MIRKSNASPVTIRSLTPRCHQAVWQYLSHKTKRQNDEEVEDKSEEESVPELYAIDPDYLRLGGATLGVEGPIDPRIVEEYADNYGLETAAGKSQYSKG